MNVDQAYLLHSHLQSNYVSYYPIQSLGSEGIDCMQGNRRGCHEARCRNYCSRGRQWMHDHMLVWGAGRCFLKEVPMATQAAKGTNNDSASQAQSYQTAGDSLPEACPGLIWGCPNFCMGKFTTARGLWTGKAEPLCWLPSQH